MRDRNTVKSFINPLIGNGGFVEEREKDFTAFPITPKLFYRVVVGTLSELFKLPKDDRSTVARIGASHDVA